MGHGLRGSIESLVSRDLHLQAVNLMIRYVLTTLDC